MSFSDFLGGLFAGSTTPLSGITELGGQKASVGQIFSGINYLQALSTSTRASLQADLQGGKFKYFPDSNTKEQKANNNAHDTNHASSTDSIFNKFTVFAYQNFQSSGTYKPQMHFIGAYNTDTELLQDESDVRGRDLKVLREKRANAVPPKNPAESKQGLASTSNLAGVRRTATILANPNAANIIDWANKTSSISITGFQPYAMTDFMFCKYYGKIPNNRLVTLRRYPFPIDDQIKIRKDGLYHSPIPIAQAVTWFGGDTKNILSQIGVLNWSMPFAKINALGGTVSKGTQAQNIDGNEMLMDDLLKFADKIDGLGPVVNGLKKISVALLGSNAQYQSVIGTEKKLQQYAKELYTADGPYWNRIFGPVNVIHESTQRQRGMQTNWEKPFPLNFHYQFRSFNGLSPKIVALDLISNFLNLTYNDAQFLGQLARYFPKVGLKFDETINEVLGGLLTKASISLGADLAGDMITLIALLKEAAAAATGLAAAQFKDPKTLAARVAQVATMDALQTAVPAMIPIRSALSDRPVGEWHLVVGNPLNPIMVMGDLICKGCTMVFDEEFGPDDFPTGVTFTLSLSQGKPRDKISIERMFNLGESQLAGSILRAPSSAEDTFGLPNTKLFESLSTLKDKRSRDIDQARTKAIQEEIQKQPAFAKYQNRVRKSYGYNANAAAGASGKGEQQDGAVNDSLLYMYFDKSLDRQ